MLAVSTKNLYLKANIITRVEQRHREKEVNLYPFRRINKMILYLVIFIKSFGLSNFKLL